MHPGWWGLIIALVIYSVIFHFTKNHYLSVAIFVLLGYLLFKLGKESSKEELIEKINDLEEEKLRRKKGLISEKSQYSEWDLNRIEEELLSLKTNFDELIQKEKDGKEAQKLIEKLIEEYDSRGIKYSYTDFANLSLGDLKDKLKDFSDNDALRDADIQDKAYKYEIGQHANEALALRYGLVNNKKIIERGYVYERGGEKVHAPEKDKTRYVPAANIRVQKIEKLGANKFRVKLPDFGNREAVAIHEKGTNYIKTFYPLDDTWFEENINLELALKNNSAFTLKELAKFHVDAIISGKK